MSILFGHPTGNPNSYQAALAHFAAGRLEAFCVPWMPSGCTVDALGGTRLLQPMVHRLGKACVYDMPIGYYPAWAEIETSLARKYVDWLPPGGLPSRRHVRPEQKRQEMDLADLVLVPSSFAAGTIRAFHPYKAVALAA